MTGVRQDGVSSGQPDLKGDPLIQKVPISHRQPKIDLFGLPMRQVTVEGGQGIEHLLPIVVAESGA
jgi:hypothetical protein